MSRRSISLLAVLTMVAGLLMILPIAPAAAGGTAANPFYTVDENGTWAGVNINQSVTCETGDVAVAGGWHLRSNAWVTKSWNAGANETWEFFGRRSTTVDNFAKFWAVCYDTSAAGGNPWYDQTGSWFVFSATGFAVQPTCALGDIAVSGGFFIDRNQPTSVANTSTGDRPSSGEWTMITGGTPRQAGGNALPARAMCYDTSIGDGLHGPGAIYDGSTVTSLFNGVNVSGNPACDPNDTAINGGFAWRPQDHNPNTYRVDGFFVNKSRNPALGSSWDFQGRLNDGQDARITEVEMHAVCFRQLGSLTVVKDALPEDDSPFDFSVGPEGGPVAYQFTLMDPSDNTWTQNVQPGRWRVAENLQTLPAGRWFFRGGVCRDLNNPREPEVVITPGARFASATIQVDAGDRWRCVFSNREWARVEIFKQTRTEHPLTDPDVEFPFRTDIPEGPVNFSLADGESIVFDMVPEGEHNVVEQQGAMPPRWFLTGIGCDDAGRKHRSNIDTGLLALDLDWGDEIICRFVNEEGFLDVEKWTNGHDADQMPGPEIPVGEPITWKYIVTNRGPEPMTNISVVDDQLGPIACPKSTLAPDESMTCTAQGTAQAGQYKNVATATGWLDGEEYSNSDPSHYFGLQGDYDLKIVKRGPSYAAPGSTVTYQYFVWNQHWGSAVAPVVTDDKCAPVTYHSGDWNNDGLVQFGEAWKFTCDFDVPADAVFTMIVNIATVGPLDQDLNPGDNQAWWWMPVVPWAGGFGGWW